MGAAAAPGDERLTEAHRFVRELCARVRPNQLRAGGHDDGESAKLACKVVAIDAVVHKDVTKARRTLQADRYVVLAAVGATDGVHVAIDQEGRRIRHGVEWWVHRHM